MTSREGCLTSRVVRIVNFLWTRRCSYRMYYNRGNRSKSSRNRQATTFKCQMRKKALTRIIV